MATCANSTPAPVVQTGLLRPPEGNAVAAPPSRPKLPLSPLLSACVLHGGAECADTSTLSAFYGEAPNLCGTQVLACRPDTPSHRLGALISTLLRGSPRGGALICAAVEQIPRPLLSPPAPLPSLTHALSRRRAIFGAVAVAAAPLAAVPAVAGVLKSEQPHDARLIAHYDKLHALDAEIRALCEAHPRMNCDQMPGWGDLEGRRTVALYQIAETPAVTLAGIAAKARVLQTREVQEIGEWSEVVANSIAVDVLRLHERAHG